MSYQFIRDLERSERAIKGLHARILDLEDRARAVRESVLAIFATRPRSGPPCEITIHVRDEAGDPIAGASVTISGDTVVTDAAGDALFDDLGAGTYVVTVTAPGFMPNTSSRALACDGTVAITLADSVSCSLRVFGCSSQPLPGANVEIYTLGGDLVVETTANSSGIASFELPAPGPGNHRVVVTAKRFDTYDQVRTLTCTTPIVAVTLSIASGYRCVTCCGPYPQPIEWGIELPGLGTLMVEDPEGDCTWNGLTTVDVPGSTNLYDTMTEYADPDTYSDCLGGGSIFSVLRERIYCCETVPVGKMCASMATQMAYHYTATSGTTGQFGAFVLLEDLGIITINAPFRLKIEHSIFGGTTLRVGTKTLRPWILGDRLPDPGGCRPEAFNQFAWLDPTVPSYTLNTGAEFLPGPSNPRLSGDCLATGTVDRAVPEMDFGDFAVMGGTLEEICYADEFTLTVPPFTVWPWGMESIRVFDPNASPPPGPMMMRAPAGPGPSAAKAAPRIHPPGVTKALHALIRNCPHLAPREPGDICGCVGRCTADKGDLHEGRSSYKNCVDCVSPQLGNVEDL